MIKYLFSFFILWSLAGSAIAQSGGDTLFVVPGKQNLYFYHVVEKGESLYGLARSYRLEPRELAGANAMTLQTPLKLFQLLKIPLNGNNLVQDAGTDVSGLTPLYHKVIKGETLYRISQMHDKVDTGLLAQWNNLTGGEVKTGQYVIVGWLRAADTAPAEAVTERNDREPVQAAAENPVAGNALPSALPGPKEREIPASSSGGQMAAADESGGSFLREVIAAENRNRNPVTAAAGVAAPAAEASSGPGKPSPAESKDTATFTPPAADEKPAALPETTPSEPQKEPAIVEEKAVTEKPAPEKEIKKAAPAPPNPFADMLDKITTHKPPAEARAPVSVPAGQDPAAGEETADSGTSAADTKKAAVSLENAAGPVNEPPAALPPAELPGVENPVTSAKSEFEQEFQQQTAGEERVAKKKGAAGWFRSNVKAGSGRYYALCDDLPRGAIIKVVNPISGKYVLAKVLDAIPKQKENYNLIVKLSDAAQEDLGVDQSRFWCEIEFAEDQGKK